jgi:hypothetical protein
MCVMPDSTARAPARESTQPEFSHGLIDDCTLARRVKAAGRVWLGIADETRSVRPYGTWRTLWDMIARCAFAQLGYSNAVLAGCILGMALTYLMPPLLLLLSAEPLAMALGGAAWLGMSAAFMPILRYYRCSPLLAPLLPAIAVLHGGDGRLGGAVLARTRRRVEGPLSGRVGIV